MASCTKITDDTRHNNNISTFTCDDKVDSEIISILCKHFEMFSAPPSSPPSPRRRRVANIKSLDWLFGCISARTGNVDFVMGLAMQTREIVKSQSPLMSTSWKFACHLCLSCQVATCPFVWCNSTFVPAPAVSTSLDKECDVLSFGDQIFNSCTI